MLVSYSRNSTPNVTLNIRIQACIVGLIVRGLWQWWHRLGCRVFICGKNTGLDSSDGWVCGERDETDMLLHHFERRDSTVTLPPDYSRLQCSKSLPVPRGARRYG